MALGLERQEGGMSDLEVNWYHKMRGKLKWMSDLVGAYKETIHFDYGEFKW